MQHHLYDADKTGWLGVARIAMGWPLAALGALVTYLAIRTAQRALHAEHAAQQPTQCWPAAGARSRADGRPGRLTALGQQSAQVHLDIGRGHEQQFVAPSSG